MNQARRLKGEEDGEGRGGQGSTRDSESRRMAGRPTCRARRWQRQELMGNDNGGGGDGVGDAGWRAGQGSGQGKRDVVDVACRM